VVPDAIAVIRKAAQAGYGRPRLSEETIWRFGIGFAPRDGRPAHRASLEADRSLLFDAGLLISDDGGLYDRFRHGSCSIRDTAALLPSAARAHR
jgi:hypothetical protein